MSQHINSADLADRFMKTKPIYEDPKGFMAGLTVRRQRIQDATPSGLEGREKESSAEGVAGRGWR